MEQYALYTLANSILGSMSVLSDGGISNATMAEGGKVWQDRDKLGAVITIGLRLRRVFGAMACLIGTPFLLWSLKSHGATTLQMILMTLSVLLSFSLALSGNILVIPFSLHQRMRELSGIGLVQSLMRIGALAVSVVALPLGWVALLAAGLPQLWANIRLRARSGRFLKLGSETDTEAKKRILKLTYRSLPGSIYFAISGQITVWLLAIFSNSTSIAGLGALGRLGQVFSVINVIFSAVVIPRFARINSEDFIIRKYQKALIYILALTVVINLLFINNATVICHILGSKYSFDKKVMGYYFIGASIALLEGCAYQLGASRGIILQPAIDLSLKLIIEVILLITLSFNTLIGVLEFTMIRATLGLIIQLANTYIHIRNEK